MSARSLQIVLVPVILMGLAAAQMREGWAQLVFGLMAYAVLGCGLVLQGRKWGDLVNPLTVLTGVGFLKFSVPFFLYLALGPTADCFAFYARLGVLEPDLMRRGHTVALLGLCGLLFGWNALRNAPGSPLARPESTGWTAAVRALSLMVIGGTSLMLFVGRNADFGTALATGQFRTTQIQGGTGVFFYLAFALIAGSVVLSCWLLEKRAVPGAVAFLPVLVAMTLYFIAGGRTRAITPVIATVLAFYYIRLDHRLGIKALLGGALFCVSLPVFYYLGSAFRGGAGLSLFTDGVGEETSSFGEYLAGFFVAELGQLNSLAGAVSIGDGVLGGLSFTSMLFPLSMMFEIPGRSAGIFLAEELLSLPSAHLAALNSTLIGDAYLNFGLLGVPVVLALAGGALKLLYVRFRSGRVPFALLGLVMIYAVRVFGEEINKWPEMLIIMTFSWLATIGLPFSRLARDDDSSPAFAGSSRRAEA